MTSFAIADSEQIDQKIAECVQRAIAGEGNLHEFVTQLLFGRSPGKNDPEWSREYRQIWDRAVVLWRVTRAHTMESRVVGYGVRRVPKQPEIAAVWKAILKGAAGSNWKTGQHLRWGQLAKRLNISQRSAQFLLGREQGWRFEGNGDARRCVAAPCEDCGNVFPVSEIADQLCPACRTVAFVDPAETDGVPSERAKLPESIPMTGTTLK